MAFFGLFRNNEDKDTLEQKKALWESRSAKIKTWMFVLAIIFEVGLLLFFAKQYGLLGEGVPPGQKVAVVDFNQPVTQAYVNKIMKHMEKAKENKDYKEILFIMNSPGGSPTASEELSEYLKSYAKDKNITMYIQGIAASGGYYIASAVKPLYVNKNAIVGSIGVILPHYSIEKLAKRIGVEEDELSAGKYKKPISFFKKIAQEDKEYLQKQLLKPTYENFITAVAENRGIERQKLLPYTEGKIFVGNDASIKGVLVDEVSVLSRVKENLKNRLGKKIKFVNILPKEKFGFLKDKVEFKFSLDTGFDEGMR